MVKKNNKPVCKTSSCGDKYWSLDNKLHREDGPALECPDGYKAWYYHGQRHRVDGPAIERADGSKEWYFHGKLHRLDGPVYEGTNGAKEWHYHGEYINCSSQEEFERLIKLKVLW